jgi:tetratricopeptide (TPR) repeat protein
MMDPQLFGRYKVVRKLAGGGMGRVFLAYDPVLNRHVGLKLIDSGSDRDSIDAVTAERRGAVLQDQLAKREPSGRVAQIFDVGEREGYFYIAMEYIEGEDLSEVVARGPLEPQRAVDIALDVLDVLVKAHNFQATIEDRRHRGIIHGDIKPRNIRITPAGQVKVLDFGIAKAVSMTRSITFNQYGSVPYSSPERLQTGDMDAKSDVWSVATVLFEMLTGKPYFESLASSKLEWMIRNYRALQPSIRSLPSGLREVLSRALDPDVNRRFASAAAFQAALHEWKTCAAAGAPETADPDATRRTVYPNPAESTRRMDQQAARPAMGLRPPIILRKMALPSVPPRLANHLFRAGVGALVALFLVTVFTLVYEIRMWDNAEALRQQVDAGRVGLDDAKNAYFALARRSLFSLPLYPARSSLRDRFTAEADRVIADYREASESTPVYRRDWLRAQSALASALAVAPGDKSIRGKTFLTDGNLNLLAGNLRGARANFEEARALLPHSPDPHLGLAFIHMNEGDLDKAEDELNEAKRNGLRPGRREQAALANGYKARGEKWLAEARRAHDIGRMQDSLKHADSDLAHAQDLFNSVAPFRNGVEMAEKVSLERDRAAKTLAQAQAAQQLQASSTPVPDPPKESQ